MAHPPQPDQNGASTSPEPNQLRPPKPLYSRWFFWFILILVAGTTGAVTKGYQVWQAVESALPDVEEIDTFVREGTLTIKASDGSILQQLGPATREKLSYEEIPDQVIDAFISAEDRRFYEHRGVDYPSIARATVANFQQRQVVEGASTITQQLSRIVFLDQEASLQRKFREALLARKVERELDKEGILESYLNLVYLGAGAYGVADAAWIYFGKSVDELELSEAAMIAGMAPAPSVYSPIINPEAARRQRNLVLDRMQVDGFITESQSNVASSRDLTLNPKLPRYLYSETPYFTTYIQQQLAEILSPEEIELGGLTVETTLNPTWQKAAIKTVRETIAENGQYENFQQAALVAVDPRDGGIKAMVGGDDFAESQFNRVTQALRQPGSTFKTLLYTTAIASGMSPYKTYVDAKYVVDGYEPKNYSGKFSGPVSLRQALASSINIVAVKTIVDVGFDPVIEMSKRMGIQSELLPTYSLSLGASEVNLLEITSAYGTLAAEGNYAETHGIVRVLNNKGEVVYEIDAEPTRAVDANTAAIMTWMLRGVVEGGTGAAAQIGRPVAGKTGTSEKDRDLWFIGYIPQLSVGVWLGNDDNSRTWGVSGTAAYTWRKFMLQIAESIPVEEFPPLPNLNNRKGSIAAKPVKPRKVNASKTASRTEEKPLDNSTTDNLEPNDAQEDIFPPGNGADDPPVDEGLPDDPAEPIEEGDPPVAEDLPPADVGPGPETDPIPVADPLPPAEPPPPVVAPIEPAPEAVPVDAP